MAINQAMNDASSHRQDSHAGARNGYLHAQSVRPQGNPRSHGPLASVRDMVRDTVYTTFDALRGRYDR
jgi:hypothetical protein